jgi:hypothetical protein
MKAFALALVLFAGSAQADLVASNRAGDELRLMNGACTNERILEGIRDEWQDKFKAGQAAIKGKTIALCWIDVTEHGAYFMAFADGESIAMAVSSFIEQPGI